MVLAAMPGLFSKERIVAPPGFNRWRVPLASAAIHLCIGSVYAWSIFNPPLTRVQGVVTSSAEDWTLAEASRTFVVAIVFLGLSVAVAVISSAFHWPPGLQRLPRDGRIAVIASSAAICTVK
jgi:hypothetical protein